MTKGGVASADKALQTATGDVVGDKAAAKYRACCCYSPGFVLFGTSNIF